MPQFIVFLTQTPIEADDFDDAAQKAAKYFMQPETDKYLVVECDTMGTMPEEYPVTIRDIAVGPRRAPQASDG